MLRMSVPTSAARARMRATYRLVMIGLGLLLAALASVAVGTANAATVSLPVPGTHTAGGRPAPASVDARELRGEWTARSRTYELQDGRRLAKVFGADVNFRDAHGDWQAID